MSKYLARDLEELHRQVLNLAGSVEQAIGKSVEALKAHDRRLAEEVIEADDLIDELENRINDNCLRILALHQPVAKDLRRTVSVLMINADLERMGDLATGVAERSLELPEWAADAKPAALTEMGRLTMELVSSALDAFVQLDADEARQVIRDDKHVNEHNDAIIAELTERMKGEPRWVEPGLSLFALTRHLERIADHATNIAEDVVYLVEGEVMRHRFPEPQYAADDT